MSSNMYSFHKTIHSATGVEHSLYCNFYDLHSKNLVIAGANQLRVFRLVQDSQELVDDGKLNCAKKKLECLQTFSLFGEIESLQVVRFMSSSRDALLISFKEAKLTVVEYDPRSHDLKTLSLHYFEDDESKGGRVQIYDIPIVRVDPEHRCAAMLIYGDEIVIFPFKKDISDHTGDLPHISGAPTISSYKINIKKMDTKLANIIDIQFLYGYYEPTLLVLFEPIKTWAGRIAVRQDTCAMVAISLNIQQKVHPVIWSLENLPFDCTQVVPVPKPIGGVLIFAVNSLLYLNQSIPPFGVSLNSLADDSTTFPLKPQEGLKISLDCAQATFLSLDRVVISLKGGELYVLTLITDGMRSVRSFNIDKAAASVLTTCMTICEEGYLFLGSRLGNSLLLRYTEKVAKDEIEPVIPKDEAEDVKEGEEPQANKIEPPNKKKRLDTLGDWIASNVSEIQDKEELEVYGNEVKTCTQITQYTFEICDSLINVGPLGNISMGEPAFLSEEYSGGVDPDIELVSTCGYGKNGALSILQRSIRPQVVTTFELPGCTDMWTVIGSDEDKAVTVKEDDSNMEEDGNESGEDKKTKKVEDFKNSHAFLIIRRNDSTMILQTGEEINELDHSGFDTQSQTVFAGNIGNNKYIVQVSPLGVRLLRGLSQLQHIPLELGSPIVHASVADPYLIVLSEDGQVVVLILTETSRSGQNSVKLSISNPSLDEGSKILTLCAYKDVSGLFSCKVEKQDCDVNPDVKPEPKPSISNSVFCIIDKDGDLDDDDLLYSTNLPKSDSLTPEFNSTQAEADEKVLNLKSIEESHWLFVCRENGMLQIYELPDTKLVYSIKNFPLGLKFLADSYQSSSSFDKKFDRENETLPSVFELLVIGMGHLRQRPVLMARINEEILLYEAFFFDNSLEDEHLKLRFSKINHNMIIQDRQLHRSKKNDQNKIKINSNQLQLRCFDNIAGYSGVFICGPNPYWIFMTSHGELRYHSMALDGKVPVFAPFHNVNCDRGFLYFNKKDELRICVLPTHLSYDAPWPVRKVPLRCTPHFISYHVESKTFCVVTSTMESCDRLVKHTGEEKEFDVVEKDERYIYPMVSKFYVQLFSPVNWEAIPNTCMDMEEWEHVTTMKNVSLVSEGTMSGLKGYIAVGTNYNYGEDVTSRGRIMIADIIDVVPEPGQPLTKNKIKMVYSKEQKGPVTALCHVKGFLLASIGQKVYVWQLKDNDLIGVAFIDTHIYIHSATSIKNIVLIADIYKSVSLLCYQEETRTLALVSRDVKPSEIFSIEFFVDNVQLGFLASDVDKNLVLYSYQPEARESFGGHVLIRKGDIHIGSHINSFARIRCKLSDLQNDKKALLAAEKRHVTLYATQDGSIGSILPVSEKVYRRLLMLQNLLTSNIPHTAGLNPKAYRLYKSHRRQLVNPQKNILDGDLLFKFINLSITEKNELAKKIGTQVQFIMDDLTEIDRCTAHF